MKYFFILIILLFFGGCASIAKIYKIDNQTPKNKLIEEFNSFSGGKSLMIELKDGSSFISLSDTQIFNDSLYTVTEINSKRRIISHEKIKRLKIANTKFGAESAYLELYDGKVYNTVNVNFLSDSTIQITIVDISRRKVPLDSVYEIVYKNRILGTIPGILAGGAVGAAIGLGVAISISSKENADAYLAMPISGASGALIGGIIGFINGYDYIYQFNP